jgi:AAA+ ATPase superfamily predicted ATPase
MIGREKEKQLLENKYISLKSEFVAIYGRRRVGKTYLIRSVFKDRMHFQFTGLANSSTSKQLINFELTLKDQYPQLVKEKINNWLEAFQLFKEIILQSNEEKKVLFIDELPWLDTRKSEFIQALEHFWNGWASDRTDILLIVCGSSASWMINKLINNKGGLHNRITAKLKIEPFKLKECKAYIENKQIVLSDYHLIELYMVLGGIPYYWDAVEQGKSTFQLIQSICFENNGILKSEFNTVFKSLFTHGEKHEIIIESIALKNKGLTREEIIKNTKLPNGGSLTRMLKELEESGFIRSYAPMGKKTKNTLYQLIDFYSGFYLKFIKPNQKQEVNWLSKIDNPEYQAWTGYAFEQLCLYHTLEIKKALGIQGIDSKQYSWKSTTTIEGAQIDLLIDRNDKTINLCEIKFASSEYIIEKKYDLNLRNKINAFKLETKTKKSIHLTMITPYGIANNQYSGLVQNSLTMNCLFE